MSDDPRQHQLSPTLSRADRVVHIARTDCGSCAVHSVNRLQRVAQPQTTLQSCAVAMHASAHDPARPHPTPPHATQVLMKVVKCCNPLYNRRRGRTPPASTIGDRRESGLPPWITYIAWPLWNSRPPKVRATAHRAICVTLSANRWSDDAVSHSLRAGRES